MIRSFWSLPESFVGRMQYAPTRVRKCYAMIRSFWSLPESFMWRMQYAPTTGTKMLCDDSFFPTPSGIVCGAYAIRLYTDAKMLCDDSFFSIPSGIVCGAYVIRPYPSGWKKKVSKCFCDTFWGSKSNQNILEVLFEAQNRVQILLWCFLRLKIESKCFWGAFWGSKSSQNIFEVLFEAQNGVKVFLRSIFCIRWR